MKLSDFSYHLSQKLIAQELAEPRDSCRLMILDRESGELEHHKFWEMKDFLTNADVLVLNDTKVFPARLLGKKATGGKVEILLTHQLKDHVWEFISKPGLKEGAQVRLGELKLSVLKAGQNGITTGKFNLEGDSFWSALDLVGHTPLPPYIKGKGTEAKIRDEYQTVYAQALGSAAAPTAGFHFTTELLGELQEKGVEIHRVTLHVSLGTFRPVKEAAIEKHVMHPEWFSLTKETAESLNEAKHQKGKRIIAVGTTATRVLESNTTKHGQLEAREGETNIFIYPPYRFRFVDALLTNFHLPRSTLLMMVAAFSSYPNSSHRFINFAGSPLGRAYGEAIEQGYRFYSFGDAMLVL